MAVLKIACRKCGQKVSGDESFYGSIVECPICSSDIVFPDHPPDFSSSEPSASPPALPPAPSDLIPGGSAKSPPHKEVAHLPTAGFDPLDLPDDPPPALPPSRKTEAIPLSPQEREPARENRAPKTTDDEEGDEVPPSPVLATVSMVIGILNFVFCFTPSILFAPIGIICGHIALVRARHSSVQPAPGYGMAIAGLVLGYVSFILFCVLLVVIAVMRARFDFVPKAV